MDQWKIVPMTPPQVQCIESLLAWFKTQEMYIYKSHINTVLKKIYKKINYCSYSSSISKYYSKLPFQITKQEIDQFRLDTVFPSCLVELRWTGGKQVPPERLCHQVTLKGAKSPAFFHIRHDPQTTGEGNSITYSYTSPRTQ